METWYDSFIGSEDAERQLTRTAVLLAKVRYDEQLGPFVTSAERLEYVEDEIQRIIAEVSEEVHADPAQVEAKLKTILADAVSELSDTGVVLPVSKPETQTLTNEEGSVPGTSTSDKLLEPQATTDVNDHGAVLEDEILEADKTIDVQGSCIRCSTKTAAVDSPVCTECNDEIIALAAPGDPDTFTTEIDSPPLGEQPLPYAVGDRVVLVKDEARGLKGTVAEVVKDTGDGQACYVLELDEAYQGDTKTPCLFEGAFARARGDLETQGSAEDLIWKKADGTTMNVGQPQTGVAPGTPLAPAAPQPLNPSAPYQCVVCGFTGTFDAVNQHLATANDTNHMRAKDPNAQGQVQAPPTAPAAPVVGQQPGYGQPQAVGAAKEAAPGDPGDMGGGPPLGPPPGATPPPAPTPSEEKAPGADDRGPVKDPIDNEQQTPQGHFEQITTAMANRAAAREYSIISDTEAQALAQQYGLDAEEVKKSAVVQATFGDFSATNGKVDGNEVSQVPEGYVEVGLTGQQGKVDGHQAIVPTNSAVKKVSEDLGMDPAHVYDAIKESFGGDLSDQYHTQVSGEHHFYLPQETVNNAQPPQQLDQQMPQQPQPQQAPPEQQMPQNPEEEQMGV